MWDCRQVFDADLDPDRVRHLVRHALADVSASGVVRVTVFDPALELGHPGADAEPQVLVTTRPVAHTPLPALRLQSAVHCRDMPQVKHVGFVDGDQIVWPQADCLLGVTMRLVSQALDEDATTVPVTLGQLAAVDAVFTTNATGGIRPVSAMDQSVVVSVVGSVKTRLPRRSSVAIVVSSSLLTGSSVSMRRLACRSRARSIALRTLRALANRG